MAMIASACTGNDDRSAVPKQS